MTAGPPRSAAAIQTWLVGQLAAAAGRPVAAVDPDISFRDLGLSSATAVSLLGAAEEMLGRPVPPSAIWEHGSPARLARFLSTGTAAGRDTDAPGDPMRAGPAEPIAIVGVGLRLPGGVDSAETFWRLLCDGVDAVREVPESRWTVDPDEVRRAGADPAACRWAALLDEVDRFDAGFFRIAPREAEAMDPQQRLLLEVSWEAIERAMPLERLRAGRTGVFVGIANSDYGRLQAQAEHGGIGAYAASGSALSIAANRLSYVFDLHGPSLAVDTACSSSLVALHLACQSLWLGETDAALVGGVNLLLSPTVGLSYGLIGGMSPDGRCQAFDAAANGIVRGEGAAVVVLEPLSVARRHGDPVIAVIRGTAVNQDGRTNGLTAPSRTAQTEVIRRAWRTGGIDPADVGLVETHGPGTALGDPIEVAALAEAVGDAGVRCALGSVKTNLGHLEAAAGLVGLVKAALCVQHGKVPPNLHFTRPNPRIRFDDIPFFVPVTVSDWPITADRRVAGVSSFGFGGTNAHAVLQNATPADALDDVPAEPDDAPHVLVVSAMTAEALAEASRQLADVAEREPSLPDLCFTAARRRTHLDHRVAVVGHDRHRLAAGLRSFASHGAAAAVVSGRAPGVPPNLVWCFSGYAGRLGGAGRELDTPGPFRDAVDEVAAHIAAEAGIDVREILRDDGQVAHGDLALLQPAAFAVQVGLAAWWRAAGVRPDAVIGHSVGEVAAAYVAGALDLPDAVRVVCRRSRLLQTLHGLGGLASAELSCDQARPALAKLTGGSVSVAVEAAPDQVVLAGPADDLDRLLAAWSAEGVRCRRMDATVPGHSALVEPILDELAGALDGITPRPPATPMLSTVDPGVWDPAVDVGYWLRNVRRPVQLRQAVEQLAERGFGVFLEIGPHPVLTHSIDRTLAHRGGTPACVLASVRRDQPAADTLLTAFAQLHCQGVPVDWSARYPAGEVVPLPSYPWQRRSYWLRPGAARAPRPAAGVQPGQYELAWHRRPAPTGRRSYDWLLLGGDGYAEALAVELARRGERCRLVDSGRLDGAALADLRTGDEGWRLLDLRALATPPGVALSPPDRSEQLVIAAGSLIADLAPVGRAAVWLVTRHGQPVLGPQEPVAVDAATLWGLGRTLRLENPDLWGGLIDLDDGDPRVLARCLIDEAASGSGEDEVAYRDGERYVARFAPVTPETVGPAPAADADAAYLIVGGLGRLGRAVAGWLVERGARHLVLAGRRAPDDRHRAAVEAWTASGARVTSVQVDVTDPAAMSALFERFGADLPALQTVYHLATSRGTGRVAATRAEDAGARLAAKVRGGWLLHALCADHGVPRLVLFSSLAAPLGWRQAGHYAAANSFLDALAHERSRTGRPTLSVAWGPWYDADALDLDLVGDAGFRTAEPRACLDALGALLSQPVAVRAFGAVDWPVLAAAYRAGRALPVLDLVAGVAAGPAGPSPHRAVVGAGAGAGVDDRARTDDPVAGHARIAAEDRFEPHDAADELDRIRRMLLTHLAAVLRYDDPDEIDPQTGLFELGLDSAMSVELRRRIETQLGRGLAPTVMFEHPTVEELAVFLTAQTSDPRPGDDPRPGTDPPPDIRGRTTDPDRHDDQDGQDELIRRLADTLERLR